MLSAKSKVAVALGACLVLSGCADYLARRDTVTFGAGNAPAANEGIQAVKPFPPNAKNTTIQVDGNRIYKGPTASKPAG
jgi:hypothetical protein